MNQEKQQKLDDTHVKEFPKKHGFFKRNQTQITIIFIGILPSLILILSTFISLYYMQMLSVEAIKKFADQMYQDQIVNSKLQNYAVLYQINQQVQKISWQLNLLNGYLGRQLLGHVINNIKYRPALHNLDRSQLNQENPILLNMSKKNPLLTSIWHLVDKAYLEQLDQKELFQLKQSISVDAIWKPIKFDNQNQVARWIKIYNIYSGLTNNGFLFQTSNNISYAGYVPPKNCPYKGPYKLDVRCRYYYQPTVDDISIHIFAASSNFGTNGFYYSSNFCQRRTNLRSQKKNDIFSIMCITLNLSTIPIFFSNFGKNSKFQMLIDPQSLQLVYNSQDQMYSSQSTIMQVETDYLQDQSQAQIFLGNLTLNSNILLLNTSEYSLDQQLNISQKSFEYNRNGTDCFVHLNIISMIDKLPKIEILRNNKLDKYQLKNVYLFVDVLTKENLQIYAINLENTIRFYNYIFAYVSWGLIFLILGIQIYYSFLMGQNILNPVIHLTEILKQIQIQNSKEKQIEKENKQDKSEVNNSLNLSQSVASQNQQDLDPQILIDEQIDADFEGVCGSRDTQDLLNSFQDLFKVLRFTTQNFYKEDSGQQLLNLINQIEHFKQFGNNRALGVCYNNMGVIHFNCGRHQEACENFQNAIIYANYELDVYSHEGGGNQFTNQVKRLTVHLRSSLENKTYNQGLTDSENLCQLFNIKQKCWKDDYYNNYQIELYWSLYNRKMNYFKSMLNYIQENKNNLWDILEDEALESLSISEIYLPPCRKREIINYYALSKGLINQESYSQESTVLNKLSQIYIKIYEDKYSKLFQDCPNYFYKNFEKYEKLKESNTFYDYLINSKKILNQKNKDNNNSSSTILLSPIKKILKGKQNMNIKNKIKNKVYNLISYQIISEMKNLFNQPKTFNQTLNIESNKKIDKKNKQFNNQQKLNSIFYQKSKKQKDRKLNAPQKFVKELNYSNPSLLLNFKRINFSPKIIFGQINQNFEKNNLKLNKFFDQRKETMNQLQKKNQKFIFYQVRKHKNNKKVRNYQFSSDIYFQYCSLEQARYQIKQQNFYNAALVLTNLLEQCKYYLPHLKKQVMNLLLQIFKQNKLKSIELEVENQKYSEMINYNFNIFVISACQKNNSKLKLFSLCNDIRNEILFKQNDNFGMIQYIFEEQLFTLLISATSMKLMQSNPQLFEFNLLSLILKKTNQRKSKIYDFQRKSEENELFHNFQTNLEEKSQSQYINYNSLANSNYYWKIDNSSQQGSPQIRKKQKNNKSLMQSDSINNLTIQQLSNFKNNFLEQIQLSLCTSQSSNESQIAPDQNKNTDYNQYYIQKTTQFNKANLSSPNSFITLSDLNGKSNEFSQPEEQNNKQKINKKEMKKTINFQEDKSSSNILLNLSSKQCSQIKNNQTNQDTLMSHYTLFDQKRNQNSFSFFNQKKRNSLNDNFQNNESLIQNNYGSDKRFFHQILHNQQNQYKINKSIENKEEGRLKVNSRPDISKFQSKINIQKEQNLFKNNSNQQYQFNNKIFEQNLNQFSCDSTLNQINTNRIIDQNTTIIQNLDMNFDDLIVNSDKKGDNSQKKKFQQNTSEYIFHFGIHASLKQFILNSDEKLNIYLTQNKYKNENNKKLLFQKTQHTYLIYFTDQYFQISNKNLLQKLTDLLYNLEIELLVLLVNDSQQLDEFNSLENISIDGIQIISFFNSEEKLLQYIYNNREHLKNNQIPMIIEHF